MVNDDYSVIVFKILTYLYGCLKRKYSFCETAFKAAVCKKEISDEYLTDILRGMEEMELIRGLTFVHTWGNECVLANDIRDMEITFKGVEYLQNNDSMKQILKNILKEAGMITELAKIVFSICP